METGILMDTFLLSAASLVSLVTALIHSYFGEKRLISPLVRSNRGVMKHDLAKQVVRFAWHWTSALWVLIAVYLGLSALGQIAHQKLLLSVGVFHLVAGIFDGLFTRGKHIGWPPITLIGVLVLATFFS